MCSLIHCQTLYLRLPSLSLPHLLREVGESREVLLNCRRFRHLPERGWSCPH